METFMQVVWGLVITLALGVVPIVILVLPIFLRWLAEENKQTGKKEVLFATVQEGQARPIEWNRRFHGFIMSYAGYCFAGELPDSGLDRNQAEYWEVVPDDRPPRRYSLLAKMFNLPAYSGLHFMGPPFIAQIPRSRFTWVEWDFIRQNGSPTTEKGPIPHEELIGHILVQGDVYYIQVFAAETREGVPVDVKCLFTININNPYKAGYRVQDWLEIVTNQAEADIRTFVGTEKVLDMLTVTAGNQEGVVAVTISDRSRAELESILATGMARYRRDYGVNVSLPQIQSVEPAGPNADRYRALITQQFESEMGALATRTAADAKAYEIRAIAAAEKDAAVEVLGTVSELKGGAKLFRAQQIGRLQQLRVLVEGGGNRPGVTIPTDSE